MNDSQAPRGIRNNNPGNIREDIHGGDLWEGEAEGEWDRDFEEFAHPVFGVRALARILINYQRRHNLRNVADIISRWAPPSENDTLSYVRYVAAELGVDPSTPINLLANTEDLCRLVKAIGRHENGEAAFDRAYNDHMVRAGVHLALAAG